MDREQILQKFETFQQWGSGGERAPHKPLLLLYAIGKLLRGEDRLISYTDDIEENLKNLLRDFGPRRDRYNPHFPFWRLQNDGIWEVSDADNIRQTASGDAFITDLRDYNVSGGFNENISEQLQNDSELIFEIVRNLLNAHSLRHFMKTFYKPSILNSHSKPSIRERNHPTSDKLFSEPTNINVLSAAST